MSAGRGTIVHVSADYPDAWVGTKTSAIRSLVGLVEDRFDQSVISLNRVSPSLADWRHLPRLDWREGPDASALRYVAPARGLFHATMLERVADALAARLANGPLPALLVGHKLTVEGLIVARMAELLGIPYALSVQGNTDCRILAARPDLHRRLAAIWHGAAVVFPFAPWACRRIESALGRRSGPLVPLPCPTANDDPLPPKVTGGDIATAFHLRNWKLKNLPRLAHAGGQAAQVEPDLRVAVIGGGTAAETAAAARAANAGRVVSLEGPLDHAAMPARLNRARGFAMPSLHETFGLVFVEALFAGCPIVYPSGRAVDGWFDGMPFARGVDPRSTGAIAEGLLWLHRDEAANKAAVACWQQSAHAAQFRRDAIARAFGDGLETAMGLAA